MTLSELKQQPLWLLWRRQQRGSKTAKVPCSAAGKACGTDEKYRHDWVTFDQAQQAAARIKADGIGFVIPTGMFFLDIDHRDPEDPQVRELLQRFPSYSETSVSGQGIHIYGLCDVTRLPVVRGKLSGEFYTHHPTNGLELYIGGLTNRFAVFTGNALQELPLQDCTDAILDTLNRCMRRSDPKVEKVIRDLRNQKNGAKFSRLFDEGAAEGAHSQSNLDAALCAMIAFRAGNDPDLIDAVFRRSALYREKWEREDYRSATIALGLDACRRQKGRKKERPPFIRVDSKGRETVSAPLLARYTRERLSYLLVRDSGNQREFGGAAQRHRLLPENRPQQKLRPDHGGAESGQF